MPIRFIAAVLLLQVAAVASAQTTQPAQPADRTFIGVGGQARIVYLVDASGSMQLVFGALRDGVLGSAASLAANQSFNVIAFSGKGVNTFSPNGPVAGGKDNAVKLEAWLKQVSPNGNTLPLAAFRAAFQSKPDAIYVLTDGFDQLDKSQNQLTTELARLNVGKKVQIHCILLSKEKLPDPALHQFLERIASENGGKVKVVTRDQF